jgi:hypothetical protein
MLKKLIFSLMILSFSSVLIQGQDSIASKIVIFREPNPVMALVSYRIFINNEAVAKLSNNTFYEFDCGPGEYSVYLKENPDNVIKLTIEEGQTYYIRLGMLVNFWHSVPELVPVEGQWAEASISRYRMRKIEKNSLPIVRPKNRIGLNCNMGIGFKQIPMFVMTNGDESEISFGGGLAFGLKYGYEFTKHFDLAADIDYYFSTLTPALENASVTFGRGRLSVTPSLILPFDGGYSRRMKLGAGLNYNFSPKMEIECDQISGGFNDTWKYNGAFGFHVSLIYEMSFSERISMILGIKYNNMKFEFESSKGQRIPGFEFDRPDGQGLDMLCGFYYHF